LIALIYDGDVMAFLSPGQPVRVRPHRMEGAGGDHGTGQVQGFQECGEVAGLIVLDVGLEVAQQAAAVLGDAGKMHPGAVSAAGSAGGLAVHGHGP